MSSSNNGSTPGGSNFICGVVEGFYGRPWTSEQRKELFAKLKKWGMNSYVYAPKDDCKHRAYWRDLYTVEEADQLTSLISAAKEQGITFYYALSPGLDMTYSSTKETTTLKRKLEQVSQFGCEAFALLFDDIESEMSESDKEMFQSFAHAQVTVTNEVYNHLNGPRFLFCPTQYCSTRAVPNVTRSEYLTTIGNKLAQDIDVLWTGSKVISKHLTTENVEEITSVLKRPPLIWDNLHANDYDQKRVFLGPYNGRNPALIPFLRGVLTNPNCEFHMNTIAIHTLALWSKCSEESSIDVSVSADVKLETENDEGGDEIPKFLSNNVYHPRKALRTAISEWLSEFSIKKQAYGPITKPQPQVTMVMPIIPIIPSINTCMSLTINTPTTTTSTMAPMTAMPELNTNELQALAEVCSNVVPNTTLTSPLVANNTITTMVTQATAMTMTADVVGSSIATPMPNVVMNSLVSPTKIVTDDAVQNPMLASVPMPETLPVACLPPPVAVIGRTEAEEENLEEQPLSLGNNNVIEMEDVEIEKAVEAIDVETMAVVEEIEGITALDAPSALAVDEEPMEEGVVTATGSLSSPKHPSSTKSEDVMMAENVSGGSCMTVESISENTPAAPTPGDAITMDGLHLLCDLFYLPFEHGNKALVILNEFHWLKNNSTVLVATGSKKDPVTGNKPETVEWHRRAEKFEHISQGVFDLALNLVRCHNKEIVYELYSYLWELTGVLALLVGYVKWLKLAQFPVNVNNFTQGSYTWFTKGWKESFMSGHQEPWVFRGGLVADLQRLIPVDNGNDLFLYKFPEQPNENFMKVRPYVHTDEETMLEMWTRKTFSELGVEPSDIPESLQSAPGDCLIGPFVTISPAFSMVIENGESVVSGFICGAVNAKQFYQSGQMCWWPAMVQKYPQELFSEQRSAALLADPLKGYWDRLGKRIHGSDLYDEYCEDIMTQYPAVLVCCIWPVNPQEYFSLAKRLATVLFAAFRSNGVFGVHTWLDKEKNAAAQEFYSKLGFSVVYEDLAKGRTMLGRKF